MKNSLRLLSVVLSLTAGAWCQNITASGTTCATSNACVSSQVTQAQGGATITLAGTFSATVQFEASVDGVTWKAIPSTDATPVTSATGSGVWQFNVAAYTTIRARCSAFTSGPIIVTINTSTASARGGGGSSSGGVSNVTATSPVLSSGGSTPNISISGVTALQGNAAKLQLATGTTTTGHFPSYDASGNLIDSTQPTGSSAGAANDVQIAGAGGTFAADTGVFTYNPSTHILNAGQGITTTSTGVATTLGLSGGTTSGSLPINSFGWLGPNSATFTSYFFQCPTTPPTNGQTIVFGTQVGSVVPCTYATPATGSGGVAFQLLVAVCQLTAGKSINGSFPAANAPTPDCVTGSTTTPQSGRALFSQISLSATPNQWVDQQFILPNPLTGTYNLVVKVQNDVVTAGTDYVSFQYVCAADTATALPTYSSVQSFSVAVPTGANNTYATITGTPTIASCSAGNVMYTRLGVVSGSGSPTTNNLAIHSATLFVK